MQSSGLVALLLLPLVLALGGCGDDSDDTLGPSTGSIRVIVYTTGQNLDPDGYVVTVDHANDQAVAVDDTVLFFYPVGVHRVELTGIADNCQVSGDNPRRVGVYSGSTTSITFDVGCSGVP